MSTINKINEFSKENPNCYILYLHTKGVGYSDDNININDWIDLMLYFLVDKHILCNQLLSRGFDTIGCNYLQLYKQEIPPHYSGNFWWANTNYLATLEKLDDASFSKNDAEFWLCKNNPAIYVMHNSDINHYHQSYPREKYIE